jgi:ADP-ribosyl-[dinitrogen reductase] hydrolase
MAAGGSVLTTRPRSSGDDAAFRDRVVGGVLGLALGDALGAPFEFRRAHDVPRPVPAFELRWQGLPPGTTTDDTAMARNLVRSLVERGGFDPDDLAARHLAWFRTGPPDVGTLTRRVLRRVSEGERAEDAARSVWEERGPEVSAGNGSVMYCAPLGLAFAREPDRLPDLAPRLSAVTHHDERCRTAVLAVTLCAASLSRGEPATGAVGSALERVLDRDGGEELEFLVEAAGSARPVDGPDQGFCLYAAALGLQAAAAKGSFEERLLRVVSLGGDADTNAAVAGALAGAQVGLAGLPEGWLRRLADRKGIEREAGRLADLAATLG